MRLKQLLVVGKSLAGARPDKSPYAMRRENLLPTFEGSPRFAHRKRGDDLNEPALVQGELLMKPQPGATPDAHEASSSTPFIAGPVPSPGAAKTQAEEAISSPFSAVTAVSVPEIQPGASSPLRAVASAHSGIKGAAPLKKRRNWLDFIGRKLFGRSGRRSDLVQSELTLDNIRVLRNDLEDSDLELVMKKKRVRKPGSEPARPGYPPATRPASTSSWNELTARLFEIGQQ